MPDGRKSKAAILVRNRRIFNAHGRQKSSAGICRRGMPAAIYHIRRSASASTVAATAAAALSLLLLPPPPSPMPPPPPSSGRATKSSQRSQPRQRNSTGCRRGMAALSVGCRGRMRVGRLLFLSRSDTLLAPSWWQAQARR
jgi:hypothetical protein